jgi:protein-disulfide isomerase
VLVQATRCAGGQGKFWEFKDWAFSGQEWPDEQRATNFSLAGLKEEAKKLGMNEEAFGQCIEGGAELAKIKDDAALANQMKIKGTPLIVINGQEYDGPHSVEAFVRAFRQ